MNDFCSEVQLPKKLADEVRQCVENNLHKNPYSWAHDNTIFQELSINIRYQLCMGFRNRILQRLAFFSECTNQYFIVKIVPLLKTFMIKYKEFLWHKGDSPDASKNILLSSIVKTFKLVYFIISGRINYLIRNEYFQKVTDQKYLTFKTMINGSYIGEVDIVFRRRRNFTV